MLKSLKINTSNEKWNEPLHPLQHLNGYHLVAVKFLSGQGVRTRAEGSVNEGDTLPE